MLSKRALRQATAISASGFPSGSGGRQKYFCRPNVFKGVTNGNGFAILTKGKNATIPVVVQGVMDR